MTSGKDDVFKDQIKKVRKKYNRIADQQTSAKKEKDKKLKSKLRRHQKISEDAAERAAQVELLLADTPGYLETEGSERTCKITQDLISDQVDLNTRNNIFSLDLGVFGPYCIDYTRDGRNLLLGGRKGHIASFDWKNKKLHSEFHVRETVRDVKWLHNETMYAVAQKKYTYIYDRTGMELHCLRNHIEANALEYLPYHWLIASVGNPGKLVYQDVSTGGVVSEIRVRQGPTSTMAQNRHNSVLHLGHSNGVVTLWTPSMSTPLVRMFCHRGPVLAADIDIGGRYMATTGMDKQLKLWDLRMYKLLNQYSTHSPGTSVSISDMEILSASFGSSVHTWKKPFSSSQRELYLSHSLAGSQVVDVKFAPFEDVLGIGHKGGFSSIVVPGAGNPNFDSMELNPFRTKKQRQESEIYSLLEKLQPEMIVLDPNSIASCPQFCKDDVDSDAALKKDARSDGGMTKVKRKTRGRSTATRRMLKKKSNIIDQKMINVRKMKEDMAKRRKKPARDNQADPGPPRAADILDRFKKSER